MIDSHTHLDRGPAPEAELVQAARAEGITRILTVGIDARSRRAALAAADAHEEVYAAIGHHPNNATGYDDAITGELRELAAHPRCLAIGETGLDYYRDYAPREAQLSLFRAQAGLAAELGKALVVHSRAADEATAAVLEELPDELPVVLHCFSSAGLLEPALERTWYVSFAGNLTYPKAGDLRRAAARVSRDRLLVETDSPYLAPQPVRGKRNEPANVVHTAHHLAGLRGLSYEELERTVEQNAARVFGW